MASNRMCGRHRSSRPFARKSRVLRVFASGRRRRRSVAPPLRQRAPQTVTTMRNDEDILFDKLIGGAPKVEVQGVTKVFADAATVVTALDDVSLTVNTG